MHRERAVLRAERALGPDHPSAGIALNNLALLYGTLGRYGEAEHLHRLPRSHSAPITPRSLFHLIIWRRLIARGACRSRATLQALTCDPREGAGPRPPRCRSVDAKIWPYSTRITAARARPSRCGSRDLGQASEITSCSSRSRDAGNKSALPRVPRFRGAALTAYGRWELLEGEILDAFAATIVSWAGPLGTDTRRDCSEEMGD